MTSTPWPPEFDGEPVRVRVYLDPDGVGAGSETFWAYPTATSDEYTVGNVLSFAPFGLGDIVRVVEHPWGERQVVSLVTRTGAATFAATVAPASTFDQDALADPIVADAAMTVHEAIIRQSTAAGAAVEVFTAPVAAVVLPPTLSEKEQGDWLATVTNAVSDQPDARAAMRVLVEHGDPFIWFVLCDGTDPVGVVPPMTVPQPVDPRLPDDAYRAADDLDAIAAAQSALAEYGNPSGVGRDDVIGYMQAGYDTNVGIRDEIRRGNYGTVADVASRIAILRAGLPLPPRPQTPETDIPPFRLL